jgi:hypothetical protein
MGLWQVCRAVKGDGAPYYVGAGLRPAPTKKLMRGFMGSAV